MIMIIINLKSCFRKGYKKVLDNIIAEQVEILKYNIMILLYLFCHSKFDVL